MSSQIYLMRMPLGKPKPYHIRKAHAKHIDEHHQYHTPETMAKELGILTITVITYCDQKKYQTVIRDKKKPKKSKTKLFDIDSFKGGFI